MNDTSGGGNQPGLLPYERINSEALVRAILLRDGERLLVLQPYGWHIDGHHIPNAAEQFSRDGVCVDHGWEVVSEFGPYVAVVRNQQPSGLRGDPVAPRTSSDDTRDKVSSLSSTTYHGAASPGLVALVAKWRIDASNFRALAEGCKRNRKYQSEHEYNLLAAASRENADSLEAALALSGAGAQCTAETLGNTARARSEQDVETMARLYDCRRAARGILGDQFEATVQPWRAVIARHVTVRNRSILQSVIDIGTGAVGDGFALMLLMAAAVEMIEKPQSVDAVDPDVGSGKE